MKLVAWDTWGTPEQVEVDPSLVGRWGEVRIDDERVGKALFAHAEPLPGDGWHIECACDGAVADAIGENMQSVDADGRLARTLELRFSASRRCVRDVARARLIHARHRLGFSPA